MDVNAINFYDPEDAPVYITTFLSIICILSVYAYTYTSYDLISIIFLSIILGVTLIHEFIWQWRISPFGDHNDPSSNEAFNARGHILCGSTMGIIAVIVFYEALLYSPPYRFLTSLITIPGIILIFWGGQNIGEMVAFLFIDTASLLTSRYLISFSDIPEKATFIRTKEITGRYAMNKDWITQTSLTKYSNTSKRITRYVDIEDVFETDSEKVSIIEYPCEGGSLIFTFKNRNTLYSIMSANLSYEISLDTEDCEFCNSTTENIPCIKYEDSFVLNKVSESAVCEDCSTNILEEILDDPEIEDFTTEDLVINQL